MVPVRPPWVRWLRVRVRRLIKGPDPLKDAQIAHFDPEDIDQLIHLYAVAGAHIDNPPFMPYRDAHLALPAWFRQGLDPWSDEYAAQQHRLWQLISGRTRPYDAAMDEQDIGWDDSDPIKLPGFFQRRDPRAVLSASDHILAQGMLLKYSGLKPGDRALEFGPGFGQTALALARLGVDVRAVDISPRFVG